MGIQSILDSYVGKDEIITIDCYPSDDDSLAVGYLAAVDERAFLLYGIQLDGHYDGYEYHKRDEIKRIDSGTNYEKGIEKLYKYHGRTHKCIPCPEGRSLLTSLLQFAKENDLLVCITLNSDTFPAGFVEAVDDTGQVLTLRRIDQNGIAEGRNHIDFNCIHRIFCDDYRQQARKILHQLAYGQANESCQ